MTLIGLAPPHPDRPISRIRRSTVQRATLDALPVQLGPDLVGPIDVEVLGVDPGDLDLQLFVADGPGRRRALLGHPVGVRGDLAAVLGEHPADRLDPEAIPVSVDVGDYLGCRRSSSAPKKAAADFRISLARRSSLTSRSSSLILVRSSVVSPGRLPASISARRTQWRSVSWLILELRRDRLDRLPLGRVLVLVVEDHPHCPLFDLGRVGAGRPASSSAIAPSSQEVEQSAFGTPSAECSVRARQQRRTDVSNGRLWSSCGLLATPL